MVENGQDKHGLPTGAERFFEIPNFKIEVFEALNNKYLFNDSFLVIISERSAQFIIIHARSMFQISPSPCNFLLVFKFKLSGFAIGPAYHVIALFVQ